MNAISSIPAFSAIDADPGGTLKRFDDYIKQMKLLFTLVFRKSDGTAYTPTNGEKKAMTLLKGGKDMHTLFEHVGSVTDTDTFEEAIAKIRAKLTERTNKVVQRNMLLSNFPQGNKSFEKWSQEVSEAAKLIDYDNYNWKQAAVDAIILQTSSKKLRERALQENVDFDNLLKIGIAKEQSEKGAALLEQASGQSSSTNPVDEEVRRLRIENEWLKSKGSQNQEFSRQRKDTRVCPRCGSERCSQGTRCAANGKRCSNCGKMNHFARSCRIPKKKNTVGRFDDHSDSETEELGRIIVAKMESQNGASNLETTVKVQGIVNQQKAVQMKLITDSGVSKTLLNHNDWVAIKQQSELVKTSKGFRPYGTAYKLPIIGRAHVTLTAEAGAKINTWAYVVKDKKEQSLLGKSDAERLGIIKLNPRGATAEVVNQIKEIPKAEQLAKKSFVEDPERSESFIREFPRLFSNRTGKFKGKPIKIHVKPDAVPVIQGARRIPMHYIEPTKREIKRMLDEDIIEGPISIEEPGTFLSNLVITDKKESMKEKIRVTLDCQAVNKEIHPTHEPMPTVEELRHEFKGSEVFSTVDMTNCYHQFEIEESARKLFAFRTPWGIYRYKRMVMGTSPASSEIQKRIRETIKDCPNTVHIKDDIVIHGTRGNHDGFLRNTLRTLQEKGITLRPEKCKLRKSEIKWFGYIFSEAGMSTDPDKCRVLKEWVRPESGKEVKSFLQTVQFNAKFLGGTDDQDSYPALTEPLRNLTKKNATFVWGTAQQRSFDEIKKRLCSERVMTPYDTERKTRMYVDSSPVGTQATIAQLHRSSGEELWKPVNHTSRSWTKAEAAYGQIERESNGILTGMMMNKMYTLGTPVEIVTDHKPLIPLYNAASRPKNLRVDRHRTKLLPFNYTLIHEPGESSPCDYGSRHPTSHHITREEETEWCIEDDSDIFVNRVISDNLPHAITIDELKEESRADPQIRDLMANIGTGRCPDNEQLKAFKQVFPELWTTDNILMRNDQIVIPAKLRARAIETAHQSHQNIDKTLKLLRQTCWFPQMNRAVSDFVESCISCNAASNHNPPVPLEPNLLPDRAWQNLHADFKGPIAGSYYLHVVIDQYSKYPEVDVLKSTEFTKLQPVLDRIFATHGIPETLTTDNGPPYSSHKMSEYARDMGFKLTPVTPEDPQSNGFAENFVKLMCKLVHTAVADRKNPKDEVQNFLLQYRATPHPTTERSPAELLFGRKLKTKLPRIIRQEETREQRSIRELHDQKKSVQKKYFDKRYHAKQKMVKPGDRVLLKQKKTTTKPPYNPNPFTVSSVDGNRITIRHGETTRVRDKNKLKLITERPTYLKPERAARHRHVQREADIHINWREPLVSQSVRLEAPAVEVEEAANVDVQVSETAGSQAIAGATGGPRPIESFIEEIHVGDTEETGADGGPHPFNTVGQEAPASDIREPVAISESDPAETVEVETPVTAAASMEEHLEQLLRAAEERETQRVDATCDATNAAPAPMAVASTQVALPANQPAQAKASIGSGQSRRQIRTQQLLRNLRGGAHAGDG